MNSHYFSFFFPQVLDGDDDEWSEYEFSNAKAVPPKLLHVTRFFLSHGSIDIGYLPTTDGYGNVDVSVAIIITYGDNFIVLNKDEQSRLFDSISWWWFAQNDATSRKLFPSDRKLFYTNDPENGKFVVEKVNEEFLHIIVTLNECDEEGINDIKTADMDRMFKLNYIIKAKIDALLFNTRKIIEEIESLTDEYSANPHGLFRHAEHWWCDNETQIQIAANFMDFFTELIDEIKKNSENNE